MIAEEDDDTPKLSSEALAALNEYYSENFISNKHFVAEDWQLSQFWYDIATTNYIVDECLAATEDNASIACISTPTAFKGLYETSKDRLCNRKLKLFEFDRRFRALYGLDMFEFYDYKFPTKVKDEYHHSFDYIIVDPPFLAIECLTSTAITVRLLSKDNAKIHVCTGEIMEADVHRLLKLTKTAFKPQHEKNLANSFASFTNYSLNVPLSG